MKFYNYIIHYDNRERSEILECKEQMALDRIGASKFLRMKFNLSNCSSMLINTEHVVYIEEWITEKDE